MDPAIVVAICFVIMLALILLGIPIAFALFSGAIFGLYFIGGSKALLSFFYISPYTLMASYPLAVAPLFILVGTIASETGLSRSAFEAFNKWFGYLPGGILIATIGAGALFGACCGSTAASAALFSKIAIPETRARKYKEELSLGTIAASGTLATIIPPSVMVVFYGIITGTSVGKVLVAGIIPGIILAILFALYIFIYAKIRPEVAPMVKISTTWGEKMRAVLNVWPIVAVFIVIMGGIYTGFCTPTEAGALGAAVVLIYAIARRTKRESLANAFRDVLLLVAQVFLIIIAGMMLSKVVALSGITQTLMDLLVASGWSLLPVMGIIVLLYLVLGALLDPVSMLILSLPIAFPLITGLGFSDVAFGVIVIVLVASAVLTPPIGVNCFIVAGAAGVDSMKVFKGVVPFFLIQLATLALFIFFPEIILWLPNLAFN